MATNDFCLLILMLALIRAEAAKALSGRFRVRCQTLLTQHGPRVTAMASTATVGFTSLHLIHLHGCTQFLKIPLLRVWPWVRFLKCRANRAETIFGLVIDGNVPTIHSHGHQGL